MARRALRNIAANLDLSRHLKMFEQLPAPWNAKQLFDRDAPLEVEVGSGKGLFLSGAAAALPDHNFLGIEVAAKYAAHAAARLARRELPNAVVVHGDALRIFRELLPAAMTTAVHVYFPDPWWKARHKKRRVLNRAFLTDVQRTLLPGGRLHFWTDVQEYFQTTLELLTEFSQLRGPMPVPERSAQHDLDYLTHFERRTRLHNQPVYRAEFERLG